MVVTEPSLKKPLLRFWCCCQLCRARPRLACWQEHPCPPQSSPLCNGENHPSLPPRWVLWTSQEMLTGEAGGRKARAPLPTWPGPAVAHACLLTLEASHNEFLRGPSPNFPETLRLRAAAQSSRSGPHSLPPCPPPQLQPFLQLTLSLLARP